MFAFMVRFLSDVVGTLLQCIFEEGVRGDIKVFVGFHVHLLCFVDFFFLQNLNELR